MCPYFNLLILATGGCSTVQRGRQVVGGLGRHLHLRLLAGWPRQVQPVVERRCEAGQAVGGGDATRRLRPQHSGRGYHGKGMCCLDSLCVCVSL